ncbi:unnamed protein product [Paramecium octaurelia]|uniref:Uncharacterized protein n=1 Tax=Paramecium octaurelia TaxID=43137 RepID=A0A8S1STI9_PAROT|nr:unnamed protein product [Paramecium octaurelia]
MGDIIPNQLFVAGYSRSKVQDEKDVRDIFKKYGAIKEVAYKGSYSFVTFSNEQEAQEALKSTNGQTYNGQKLKVDVVDNRKGRKTGPNEEDKCFKCNKGGHWARNCPNIKSPRRSRRRSDSRSKRRHRRSESRSYSSYSSSRSRRRRYQNKRKRHSRSPRRDQRIRKRSASPKRSPSDSASSKRPNSNSKS